MSAFKSDQRQGETESFLHKNSSEKLAGPTSQRLYYASAAGAAFFIFSYVLMVAMILRSWIATGPSRPALGNEGIYSDVPIAYEMRKFQRAGFHDSRHNRTNEFEGRPNTSNDEAWDKLLRVGMVSISPAENALLSSTTAPMRGDASKYIVELEMFHQLHCLKWIRNQLWTSEASSIKGRRAKHQTTQRLEHIDHCIDYLRQVVMCHGDITPITFEWNEEIQTYLAHHSTEHVCRNFEAIYDWAEARAVRGFNIDEDHTNVELKDPKVSD